MAKVFKNRLNDGMVVVYETETQGKKSKQRTIIDESILRLAKLSATLSDKRTGKNVRYQMSDIVKAAFAIFFTQSPSFLARQRALKKSKGRSNAETIFQMQKIPCDEHIRQILDSVPPKHFYNEFHTILQQTNEQGKLKGYQVYCFPSYE